MVCYWFDHLTFGGRATEPELSVLRLLGGATLAREVENIAVPEGSVVFVHPGTWVSEWRAAAIAQKSGFVVYVSSEPGELPRLEANEHCLQRDEQDFTSTGDAATFTKSCIVGQPIWSLLKPRLRENMVALLLIELARQRAKDPGIGAAVHSRLLDEAQREYGGNLPEAEAERISALRQALAT